MILERLDKGLASENWLNMFHMVCEQHLTTVSSDHAPLMFSITSQQMNQGRCNFETLVERMEYCGNLLSKWNKEVFRNISHKIQQKELELQ